MLARCWLMVSTHSPAALPSPPPVGPPEGPPLLSLSEPPAAPGKAPAAPSSSPSPPPRSLPHPMETSDAETTRSARNNDIIQR